MVLSLFSGIFDEDTVVVTNIIGDNLDMVSLSSNDSGEWKCCCSFRNKWVNGWILGESNVATLGKAKHAGYYTGAVVTALLLSERVTLLLENIIWKSSCWFRMDMI